MILYINSISNLILLAVCMWAVLDKRVPTRTVGTLAFSVTGIFACIRAFNYGSGELSEAFEAVLNLSIATLAIWFWWLWLTRCNRCRR